MTFASGAASDNAGHALSWAELVNIAHRNYHLLPQDMEPGLEATHVMQVPTGNNCRKTAACRCIRVTPSSFTWCCWRSIRISASRKSGAMSSAMTAAP